MGVNEKEESLSFFGDFEMVRVSMSACKWFQRWIDPSLSWDAAAYGGKKTLVVPENIVWVPDVTVYNRYRRVPRFLLGSSSISQDVVIDYDERRVIINPDGTVLQSNPSIYTTSCVLNVK